MLEDKASWEAIGYEIESGQLRAGEHVVISRPDKNSPNRIYELYNKQELVTTNVFVDRTAELNWIAESIRRDIKEEGVSPRQIMVIALDTDKAKSHLTELQLYLFQHNIPSTIPGLINDSSSFAEEGRVTLSTVYRAKGNEAAIVYILSFDSLYSYLEGVGNRNRAFASITRSKAWVRITGIGKRMEEASGEIRQILADIPEFRFVFPDMNKIRRLDAENSQRRKTVAATNSLAKKLLGTDVEAIAELDPAILEKLQKIIEEAKRENQ